MTLLPPPSDADLVHLAAARTARVSPPPASGPQVAKRPRTARQRARVPTEKETQHAVRRLLASVGARVWDTSQPFRAKITPGLPDLLAFVPGRGLVFIECKRPGGKQSPAQREFQAECEAAGVPYVLGGVDEVAAYLNDRSQAA